MEQLLLHLFGDFILQNDWMALNKKEKTWKGELACQVHCILYALPFLLITNWMAVVVIYISHYALDRTNIVSHLIAAKNGIKDVSNLGFNPDRPFALSIWLYIFTDNTIHLIFNYLAITFITLN